MVRTTDPEMLAGFLDEARACLPGILAATDAPDRQERVEEARRVSDCVKGAAALVGLPGLSYVAGLLEGAFEEIALGLLPADDAARQALGRAGALIETYLRGAGDALHSEGPLLEEACLLFRRLRREPEEGDEAALAIALACIAEETPSEPPAADLPACGEREAVDPELLEIFLDEAEGHLQSIRSLLPALAEGGREAVQAVRRSAHTLKGSAAMVGFRPLTRLAHRMEDLLDQIHAGRPITTEVVDLLMASADGLEDLAADRRDDRVLQGLYARYDRLTGASEAPSEVAATARPGADEVVRPEAPAAEAFVRVPLHRLDELVRLVSELTITRTAFEQRMKACSRQVEELQWGIERLQGVARLAPRYESPADANGHDASSPLARDLGDAVRDVAAVAQELGRLSGDAEDHVDREARLTGDIHDRLMHIRLAPFGALAARLRRTVRQAAESTHKPIDLALEGETVEVDKAVLEEMADPLMHLLRNAVDHGVESPERRRERGKPERGRVTVRAAHEGNQVVLRVADDGSGVDLEAVRARAVERGLASPEAAACLTEAELLALPFQPGFSTARQVSETSGRGVGLDVVRACVEQLNGSVTLTSRPGEGATFVIRLPMTVAVMRALLVRAYGQTFAVPLASVVRIARLGTEDAEAVEEQIRIGEDWYPRVVLGEALRLRKPEDADVGRPSVLLVETGERREAVVVDEVQGGHEIVVKDLGTHLRKVHGVSGATLRGDGAVVLILNPAELTAPPRTSSARRAGPRPLSVLVVDDSPSVRRVLTRLIQGVGWTAREAREGREALELLSAGPAPDVMLVDVDMPRMDGFEFLSAVKSQEAYRNVPVVMVTSRADARSRRKAKERGADGYVVKPYRDEELLATIRELTGTVRA